MRTTDGSGLVATAAGQRNLRHAACSVGLDPSYWYPVEFDSALPREKVIGVKFQNFHIAVFRDRHGHVHAVEDRCAHRGVRLSQGFVEDCNLRCVYHGWAYSPDGKLCNVGRELFGETLPSVRLRTYPVQLRYGLIWIFFGDIGLSKYRHLPEIPELEGERPWSCIQRSYVWKAHPTMIVNNFMDSTHATTVHNRNFWTRSLKIGAITQCKADADRVLVSQEVEMHKNGFLWYVGPRLKTNIEDTCYEYPYLWAGVGGTYKLWTLMLPIDNRTTKVFQLSLCDGVRAPFTPWLAPHWLHRFVVPFGVRFLVDPLFKADGAATEMEQLGYEEQPGISTVDQHPATRICYQFTVRKWEEHLGRSRASETVPEDKDRIERMR